MKNGPEMEEQSFQLITKSPDNLYQLVEKIYQSAAKNDPSEFVAVTTATAHHLYRGYEEFAPALLAHLSLHNERFGLAVNESLNAAILVCALCYRMGWQQQPATYLIGAALTKNIGDPDIINLRFESPRLQGDDLKRWHNRAIKSTSVLKKLGVRSRLWLRSCLQHSERIDGAGSPQRLAGHQLDSGSRLLSWASHFSQQLCPRANRPGLRPRQILRYATLKTPFAYDRQLLRATAELFSPIQPGALFRLDEEGPLLMVLGRQSRSEVLYTQVHGEDSTLAQVAAKDTWRRYATPTKGGRKLLHLYVSRFLLAREQSLSLRDGMHPPLSSLKPPEQLTAFRLELNQPEPDITKLASFIDESDEMKTRLLQRASSSNRNRQKVVNTRQAMMLLGFRRIGYTLINDLLQHRLSSRKAPSSPWFQQVSRLFGEICSQLADASGVTEPERARLLGSTFLGGMFLDHKLQELPSYAQLNGNTPAFFHPSALFGISNVTRIHQLSLALAKQWRLSPSDIKAISAAPTPNETETDLPLDSEVEASKLTYLLRLSHLLSQGVWQGGTTMQSINSDVSTECAAKLKLTPGMLSEILDKTVRQCAPFCPLPDLHHLD